MTTTRPEPAGEWSPHGVHWRPGQQPLPPAGLGPAPQVPPPWFGPQGSRGPQVPGAGPVPPRRRTPWGWIIGGSFGALVLLVIVLIAIAAALAPRTMTVSGSVVVGGRGTLQPGAGCEMPVAQGRPVTIFGADGRLVGTSSISGTNGVAVNEWNSSPSGFADGCRFTFTLSDVDASDSFYRVALGSDVSNSVGFSREQLQTTGANITYR